MSLTAILLVTVIAAWSVVPTRAQADPYLWTDKNLYVLGEEVQITLSNDGDEYMEIGGWPCVMIYKQPDLEPVWPLIFATLLWGLNPGESETWVWNQTNEYTGMPAELGTYIVKDTLGLGLSTEFEILPKLELTMSVNMDKAFLGQKINFTMVLTNVGETDVTVRFGSSQVMDLYYYAKGIGWNIWSYGRLFAAVSWSVTLKPGESFPWILTWDLYYHRSSGGFIPPKPGAYKVWGECVSDPGWYETASATTVKLVLPGDVNLDYKVDLLDAALISAHWYPSPPVGPLGYDSTFDLNGDARIDVLDLAVISAYWYPGPPKGPQVP